MNNRSRIKLIFFTAFPFILFGVYRSLASRYYLDNQYAFQVFVLVGFILSSAVLVMQIIMRDKNYFPSALFLFFGFIAALTYFLPAETYQTILAGNNVIAALFHRPGLGFYAALFFVAFIPPLIGLNPFTYYFAKRSTPEQFWNTKLFKAVNLYINYFWAALFAFSFAFQFLPDSSMQVAIPLFLQFVVGISATKYLQPFLRGRLSYVLQDQPRDYIKTAHDAIMGMPYVFNKKNAKDIFLVYQFRITGEEEFDGYLEIKNRTCEYHDGVHPSPTITIKSAADIWLKITRKEISGQEALLKGLYAHEGDPSSLMKMDQLFGPGKSNVPDKSKETGLNPSVSNFEKKYYKMRPGQIKKVFAIQSSPRKSGISKTEILTDAFLEGCKNAGADIEIAYLREKKINHCIGCFTCWTKTPGVCIYKDDVAEIMRKSEEADLVVYASPLYHYGIYSLLKKYIERTLPKLQPFLVPGAEGKTCHPAREGYKDITYSVIIGVCGFPEVNHFGAYSANYHYMANSQGELGMKIVAEIYRPGSELLSNPVYQDETARVLDAARKAGEQVVITGTVEKKIVDDIAIVRLDINQLRETANMAWDVCIKEGKPLSQLFTQNR
jgi:multimeric flavodoxin WrbA/putative sterol carrier protein